MADISKEAVESKMYLLEKRGLYYRVGNAGYTGIKEEAARYPFEEMACMFPNMDSPNQDGITCIAEDDAPEFSRACWTEAKLHHREKQITALSARVEELTVVLNRLEKETSGMLGAFAHELRPVIGNTNFRCLEEKAERAREALKGETAND